ncbi:MAG: hypothetical protein IGR76_04480, partial [Synechococcales cyanobacterium T60_A2020_003]|nr:hypothetical protein [Synechococcales cyanobacterium T60_A2020_003]
RVTVLLASHWPREDGTYDATVLYSANWDFQGRAQYRDRRAIAITYDVARLLKDRPFEKIRWEFEFTSSAKHMMGADFRDAEVLDSHAKRPEARLKVSRQTARQRVASLRR